MAVECTVTVIPIAMSWRTDGRATRLTLANAPLIDAEKSVQTTGTASVRVDRRASNEPWVTGAPIRTTLSTLWPDAVTSTKHCYALSSSALPGASAR